MSFADPATGRVILSTGRSPEPPKILLSGTCKAGDVLGYSSGWVRALATTGTAIQGLLIALKDGVSGDYIPASPDAVVAGYTGATPGGAVYVAEGTSNGQITDSAPSSSGDCNTIIGYFLSATTVQFACLSRAKTVA